MIDDKDIVNDIFLRIKQILGPEFKGQIKVLLEDEESAVRKDWGGSEPYIQKKPKNKRIKVVEKITEGKSIDVIASESGINRATVYRLLKRK